MPLGAQYAHDDPHDRSERGRGQLYVRHSQAVGPFPGRLGTLIGAPNRRNIEGRASNGSEDYP